MKKTDVLARKLKIYMQTFGKWLALAGMIGVCCGYGGAAFAISLRRVTALRISNPWLLWLLPFAGLAIVGLYRLTRTEGKSVNDLIDAVHRGETVPFWLFPSIFIGTVLTHLCGGSAGREGAALQLGGTIGGQIGRFCRLDAPDLRVAVIAGMASFFSALFGTPLTAALFATVIISADTYYHAAYLPTVTASLIACWISGRVGVAPTYFSVSVPKADPLMAARVTVLAVACALVSILFCGVLYATRRALVRWMPNSWLRVVVGGLAVIGLTFLFHSRDYNGAGMEIIAAAIQRGEVHPLAFLLKIVLTAVTLGAGYKGGGVVPAFFVGATFGCFAAPFLGIPAGFGAAIGLVCVFCGVTNSPIPAVVLAAEIFAGRGILYFALACGVTNFFSGYGGLYSSQTILRSKLKLRSLAYGEEDEKNLIVDSHE